MNRESMRDSCPFLEEIGRYRRIVPIKINTAKLIMIM